MKIEFAEIETRSERKRVQELYNKVIPSHEEWTFYAFWWKRKRSNVSFLNIYDGDKWLGFIFYSLYKGLIYVWYFALDEDDGRVVSTNDIEESVCPDTYGKVLFATLAQKYPNHRILLPVNSENEDGENVEQCLRIKQYYEKCGFRETGYFTREKNDSFELMLIGETFDIEELYSTYRSVYPLLGRLVIEGSTRNQIQKK